MVRSMCFLRWQLSLFVHLSRNAWTKFAFFQKKQTFLYRRGEPPVLHRLSWRSARIACLIKSRCLVLDMSHRLHGLRLHFIESGEDLFGALKFVFVHILCLYFHLRLEQWRFFLLQCGTFVWVRCVTSFPWHSLFIRECQSHLNVRRIIAQFYN